MPKVVHFEITAEDPGRAIDFYKNIFGWKIDKWDGPQEYWLIEAGSKNEDGINGGLMKRQDDWKGMYNTIRVDSVDDFVDDFRNRYSILLINENGFQCLAAMFEK